VPRACASILHVSTMRCGKLVHVHMAEKGQCKISPTLFGGASCGKETIRAYEAVFEAQPAYLWQKHIGCWNESLLSSVAVVVEFVREHILSPSAYSLSVTNRDHFSAPEFQGS